MLSAGGEARISECKNTGAQALDLNAGVGDFGIYHNECGGRVGRVVVGGLGAAPVYFKYYDNINTTVRRLQL